MIKFEWLTPPNEHRDCEVFVIETKDTLYIWHVCLHKNRAYILLSRYPKDMVTIVKPMDI